MKIHLTFLFLFLSVSLLGCNTLVTQPNSGHTAMHQEAVDNAAMKTVETDSPVNLSFRIDDKSLMGADVYASTQFSTAWDFEKAQKTPTHPQNVAWGSPNSENRQATIAKRIDNRNEVSQSTQFSTAWGFEKPQTTVTVPQNVAWESPNSKNRQATIANRVDNRNQVSPNTRFSTTWEFGKQQKTLNSPQNSAPTLSVKSENSPLATNSQTHQATIVKQIDEKSLMTAAVSPNTQPSVFEKKQKTLTHAQNLAPATSVKTENRQTRRATTAKRIEQKPLTTAEVSPKKEPKTLTHSQNLAPVTSVSSEKSESQLATNSQTRKATVAKPLGKEKPKSTESQLEKTNSAPNAPKTESQIQKPAPKTQALASRKTQKPPPQTQVKVSKSLSQKSPMPQAKVSKSTPITVAKKTEQRVKSQQIQSKSLKTVSKTRQTSQVKAIRQTSQIKAKKIRQTSKVKTIRQTSPVRANKIRQPRQIRASNTRQTSKVRASKSIAKKYTPRTSQKLKPQKRASITTHPTAKSAKWTERRTNPNQIIAKILAETRYNKPHQSRSRASYGNNDLWARIRNGYGFLEVDNARIQRAVDQFVRHPSYFKRIGRKAIPYLYQIVEAVEGRGLPLELALLPAIESAYEAMALSHKSAAGLWQFMPATGKEYGLVQNRWYDGRRDIIPSTQAALTYLQRLNRMFDGDWFLALAAYNYGPGNIRKAIKKNLERDRATDFWSLSLPKETRRYVPKLLALAKIVANPQQYGIRLQSIANRPYFKKIHIGHQMDLGLATRLAGLSPKEFKRLNPGYRRGVTAPQGPHYITVPVEKARLFKQRLDKIPTHVILAQIYESQEKRRKKRPQRAKIPPKPVQVAKTQTVQQHQVGRGDTLWKIAKHYGISVTSLSRLNGMETNTPLKRGHFLKIPTTVAIAQKSVGVSVKTQIIHTVRPSESLRSIARNYKVTVDQLRQWNGFQPNDLSLRTGQKLKIFPEK
jgi:membrane-bound lytic murein transglycosylase D